jgi:hypothetical protein
MTEVLMKFRNVEQKMHQIDVDFTHSLYGGSHELFEVTNELHEEME